MSQNTPQTDVLAHVRDGLARLGPQRVWRPVPGPDGSLLARGSGPDPKALADSVSGLDVADKSVADLGCNLGFFTFLARRMGARSAVGLDIDAEVVDLARLLAQLHGLDAVRFVALDFLRHSPPEPCDMALCIDFIGRQVIAKGRVDAVVAAAAAWGRHELFFTLHPVYAVADLPRPAGDLARLYPGFVRQGRFFLLDYVAAILGPAWSLCPPADSRTRNPPLAKTGKTALLCRKK